MINLKKFLLFGKSKEMYLIDRILNKIENNKSIKSVQEDYTEYRNFVNKQGYQRHSALNEYVKKEYNLYLNKNLKETSSKKTK